MDFLGASAKDKFILARDVDDAISKLENLGDHAVPLAGATWIMREQRHNAPHEKTFVCLSNIPELRRITVNDDRLIIGSMATQAQLATALSSISDLKVLSIAAGTSATPAIRRMATVGGNICTRQFSPADLVPALLALDAKIEIRGSSGNRKTSLAEFLQAREYLPPSDLVTQIIVPRNGGKSVHERLCPHRAGAYPVASLSVSLTLNPEGHIEKSFIAVGAVEHVATRWTGFEKAISGLRLEPSEMKAIAKAYVNELSPRDCIDAPGWYRLSVLPSLAAKAFKHLSEF